MDGSQSYWKGFLVSSASPALAALATNPIEVIKVRQQQAVGAGTGARVGVVGSFQHVYQTQGVRGLQSGQSITHWHNIAPLFSNWRQKSVVDVFSEEYRRTRLGSRIKKFNPHFIYDV